MTKLDGKAPLILTAAGARRLTARIRDALALADDLLVQAYAGRAWEALGHQDFAAYCAAELPELQSIKLRAPVRRERVWKLHAEGATRREIAAATGASVGSVQNDVTLLEDRPTVPATRVRKTDRTVQLLIDRGPLDVRQVTKALGCQRHEASATLTRLVESGRVAYLAPERRGLFGMFYVNVFRGE